MNPGGLTEFSWHIMIEKGGNENNLQRIKIEANKLHMHSEEESRIAFQSDLIVRIRETEECKSLNVNA